MHRQKHIRVRGVRRAHPDVRKISRAIIELAAAQAEKAAAEEDQKRTSASNDKPSPERRK